MRVDIVSSTLPPKLDGIGDYTARLAAELSTRVQVRVLTGEDSEPTQIPNVSIRQAFSAAKRRSVRHLEHVVEAGAPDWLLLQYNPYSYGRWGLNLELPMVIRSLKKRLPNMNIAVMVHEPFVPADNWKFMVMTTWQRWQLWMLGQSADVLFFSIEPWTKRFQTWWPNKPVVHLPVGSNIPFLHTSKSDARAQRGIREHATVIGLFGTAHPSRMLDRVRSAAKTVLRQANDDLLLYVGPHGQEVQVALRGIPVFDAGILTPEEVSRHFAAMDIYLAPFADGVSTRRTSFIAGLQHGVPTVGTTGPLTDEILLRERDQAFFLAPVSSAQEFDAQVMRLVRDAQLRSRMGAEGRRLFERAFAWNVIAEHLLHYLKKGG